MFQDVVLVIEQESETTTLFITAKKVKMTIFDSATFNNHEHVKAPWGISDTVMTLMLHSCILIN